ncbi:MAG: hypothetical protein KIS72_12215, partial [Luteimonas sp.]|nr:hypothetical protein [Luteimonas sp.]
MGKFLRISAWLLLVFGLVWIAVIAYWQSADVRPDGRDLALYLGFLPLAAFAILALGKRGYDSAQRKASAQATEPADGTGTDSAGTVMPQVEPVPPLAILDAGLRVPVGADPLGVLAALAQPAPPTLHDRLRDSRGFPVFAAWERDLDVDAVARRFDASGHALPSDGEAWRALALLMPMATDLLAMIAAEHWQDAPGDERRDPSRAARPLTRLQVSLFLPADWPPALAASARQWLADEAHASGIPAPHLAIETVPASSADAIWQSIPAIAREPVDPAAPVLHLLLACQSLVGARSVQRLEQSGQLLSARQPEGLVPGEGAAGVLLLAADAAGGFAHAPRTRLRAQASVRGDVSWRPRTAATQIAEQLQALFALVPDADGDGPACVVSDADLRRSRSAALCGALSQAL